MDTLLSLWLLELYPQSFASGYATLMLCPCAFHYMLGVYVGFIMFRDQEIVRQVTTKTPIKQKLYGTIPEETHV